MTNLGYFIKKVFVGVQRYSYMVLSWMVTRLLDQIQAKALKRVVSLGFIVLLYKLLDEIAMKFRI